VAHASTIDLSGSKIARWTIEQVGDRHTTNRRRDGVQDDNFQKTGFLIMSSVQAIETNNRYIDFWNAVLVPKFNTWRHILAGGLYLHSAKVFPALPLHSGDSVLDVGCGWGDTAIELARHVGPAGSVVGVDCCGAFLDAGRADATDAGLTNLTFLEADVQAYSFKPVHDFCFSRFGTQFFENPVAGLRNMRLALKPGGLMTMIVWRAQADNPWLTLSKEVLLRYLPPVKEDAATCGPGPFSMTDTEVVSQQLQIAGYSEVGFERIDAEVLVGRDLDEAVAFQLAIGPAGEVYREAGKEAERLHDKLVAALRNELKKFARPEGVMMNSSSWMVTAQNPGLSLAPGE
jgi:ubiquinone/menaquinone biosynthesis C-methylase UbiE